VKPAGILVYSVFDIGNTRTKAAQFAPGATEPLSLGVFPTGETSALLDWLDARPSEAALCSSVSHPDPAFGAALKARVPYCWELTHETPLPIRNAYGTPQTLGRDRLAGAVGAWRLFPGENVLVLDAGTCLKYDFVRADGVYLGGSISPGLSMRFAALSHFTARLPLLEQRDGDGLVGTSTETAIRTGVQYGAQFEAEGFWRAYADEQSAQRLVLTGGDADFFATRLKMPLFAAPHLVLIGLTTILEHNVRIFS
jgi:type III pantothenate kinase